MKSSLKLSLVFSVSVSLFFACSFLLLNAKADVSLQKISLGSDTIRIQTDQAIPVTDVQLLENTDHCLTDCYAILKIHPYQSINLPAEANTEFAWNFAKEKPWMDGLLSYHFEILETTEYEVQVPDYSKVLVNTTCYNEHNESYICETEQTVQTGSHEETRYAKEYKPFVFWGKTLEADKDYVIKLVGQKRARLGTNNIDWVPTIKGLELNEWEWWNSTWKKCRKLSNTTVVNVPNSYETEITFGNSTVPYADFMANAADARFTNGTDCNADGGIELTYYAKVYNTSDITKNLTFFVDMGKNYTSILMYYNASGVTSNSNCSKTFDIFCDDFEYTDSPENHGWTQVAKDDSVAFTTTTRFYEGSRSILFDVVGNGAWCELDNTTHSWGSNIFEVMYYENGTATAPGVNQIQMAGDGTRLFYHGHKSDGAGGDSNFSAWIDATKVDSNIPMTVGWHELGIEYNGSDYLYYIDDTYYLVDNITSNTPTRRSIGNHWGDNEDRYFDLAIIRHRASATPSWSIGSEETQSGITMNITVYSPQNITYNTSSVELIWSASRDVNWSVYSLNGENNVSVNVSIFVDEFDYISNFSTNTYTEAPLGITIVNDTQLWLTDYDDYSVNKYWINGTYYEDVYFGPEGMYPRSNPRGITTDDNYMWIACTPAGTSNEYVAKYWLNGTYINNFSVAEQVGDYGVEGITNDGTFLWIVDPIPENSTIYKYWMSNGTYSGQFINLSQGGIWGITIDNTYFWVTDYWSEKIHKYWLNGSYTGTSFNADANDPFGIIGDGEYLWVVSFSDDKIYKHQQYSTASNTTLTIEDGVVENSNNVTICATASDNGELSCGTRYFTVDTIPPQISLTFPENGQAYNVTSISIIGTASDTNYDTIRVNDTRFGSNLETYQNWNFTNTSISKGWYSVKITANDSVGNENSTEVYFKAGPFDVMFNITSGETGENLTSVSINCNNSYSGTIDSGDTVEFNSGSYSCTFAKTDFYNKTIEFIADDDKIIDVKLSKEKSLTIEEHNWLEYLYDCWSTGNCRQTLNNIENMVVYINQTATQINETINKVWNQFKQTDESVVLQEETTNSVVNETSNLTIEYSLSIPEKEDYQFLPIRIFYWFLSEDNTTCYGQAKDSEDAESPYCKPLVANAIGEINKVLNFTVELRPSLPAGNYTVVRRIDIDPEQVWVNYGHETIGKIEVTEESNETSVNVRTIGNTAVNKREVKAQQPSSSVTGLTVGDLFNPVAISMAIFVVTLLAVAYLIISRKSRIQ